MSEIRVENIIGETGVDAVKFTKGVNVTGIVTATSVSATNVSIGSSVTATSFFGSGAGLSGVSAGKILQVVSGSVQVAASQGFSSNSFVDTGLSASITPSSSSSKVFVTGYLSWRFEMSQNGNAQWNFAITDGSNNILDAMTNDLDGYDQDDAGGIMARKHPISFLHSPNTTSSFTYKMRMNAKYAQYSGNLIVQKNGTANNISRIILMEVAA